MVNQLVLYASEGAIITDDMFGGNLLANRGTLYGEGQYDTAIKDLGVKSLRYPGGSRTEKSFEIGNPDAEQVVDKLTGQIDNWIALTDFFAYAKENNNPVSIVIPTRFNLSDERDSNGNRLPDVDEEELRKFIKEVITGEYGTPDLNAFEIGNEYWHSGQMTSAEYGRLAAEMVAIIQDEMKLNVEIGYLQNEPQITVQMGLNYGYARSTTDFAEMSPSEIIGSLNEAYSLELGSEVFYSNGDVNWGMVQNRIIINELEQANAMEHVDGVIAHVYSTGLENEWSRIYELNLVDSAWIDKYPSLSIHVTEWNMKGVTSALDRDQDYGLHQAEEMIELMEEFARVGVDFANVWPLINFTDNALNNGWTYGETNAPGAIFRMMSDNLPGKVLLDFNPESERGTEAEFDDIQVYGFGGNDEIILYLSSSDGSAIETTNLDLSAIFSDFEEMELSLLGVESGSLIGSNTSSAFIEILEHTSYFSNGILDVSLGQEELLQVVVRGADLTPDAAAIIDIPPPHYLPSSVSMEFFRGTAGDDSFDLSGSFFKVDAGQGDDRIVTGSYADTVFGEDGNDFINTGNGEDVIWGQSGDDILVGGQGADFIDGGWGNDQMYGGQANDRLIGQNGNDNIDGGSGDDIIAGGRGDDVLKGGSGKDTFVFADNHGMDNVLDFDSSYDTLKISHHLVGNITTISDLVDRFGTVENGGTILNFGNGNMITLSDVTHPEDLYSSFEFF